MFTSILLQSAGGGITSFLPLLLVLAVMYFFFFRPQMKKQKQERKFQDEISKGMRVVTNSGIHGKILDLQEKTLTLETENSRLKVDKTAISRELSAQYLPKEDKKSAKKDKVVKKDSGKKEA
jgi:preprotein translocase subunit YajC